MYNKNIKYNEIISKIDLVREKKLSIGFANGCFDLLHEGHRCLLNEAKKICDYLVVGLNSDFSVKNLKGPSRPKDNQNIRIKKLSELQEVDAIILFDDDTPIDLLHIIKPDYLFKGEDYKGKVVAGSKFVRSYGGRLKLIKLLDGFSTTKIIESGN